MTIFYHSVAADCCNAFNFKGGPSLKRTRLRSAWKEHIENANCCCCDCLALDFFFSFKLIKLSCASFSAPWQMEISQVRKNMQWETTTKHAVGDD